MLNQLEAKKSLSTNSTQWCEFFSYEMADVGIKQYLSK